MRILVAEDNKTLAHGLVAVLRASGYAVDVVHDGVSADESELIAFARKDLGGYQTPKRILFMSYDELPKNYLGKILKRELRTKVGS